MALAFHIPEAEKTETMAINNSINQCFLSICYWLNIGIGTIENREERKDTVSILKDLIIYWSR